MGSTDWTYNSGYALEFNGTRLLIVNVPQSIDTIIAGNGWLGWVNGVPLTMNSGDVRFLGKQFKISMIDNGVGSSPRFVFFVNLGLDGTKLEFDYCELKLADAAVLKWNPLPALLTHPL
mgnify:CR=1 FL=1